MTERSNAIAKTLDVESAMDEDQFPDANTRRSPWSDLLQDLWDATNEGDIPIGGDNLPQFIKLGTFKNANGARTQIRALNKKGYDLDYEFKSITSKDGSTLWGRALLQFP